MAILNNPEGNISLLGPFLLDCVEVGLSTEAAFAGPRRSNTTDDKVDTRQGLYSFLALQRIQRTLYIVLKLLTCGVNSNYMGLSENRVYSQL